MAFRIDPSVEPGSMGDALGDKWAGPEMVPLAHRLPHRPGRSRTVPHRIETHNALSQGGDAQQKKTAFAGLSE
jgi:hypothetical protein